MSSRAETKESKGREVVHITSSDQLTGLISNNDFVVLDFYAGWCGPCLKIAPTYKTMSSLYDNILFCKVNTDDNADIAEEYSVDSMPTFVCISKTTSKKKKTGFELNTEKFSSVAGLKKVGEWCLERQTKE